MGSSQNTRFQRFDKLFILGKPSLNNRMIKTLFEAFFIGFECQIVSMEEVSSHDLSRSLLLLDALHGPEEDVYEQAYYFNSTSPAVPVLLLNVDKDDPMFQVVELPNIAAIFEMDCEETQLMMGVQAVDEGRFWLPRHYSDILLSKLRRSPSSEKIITDLSRRETEIMAQVSLGLTNEQIADKLFVSSHTIRTHLYRIYRKIGVRNRFQAIEWMRQKHASLE